MFRTLRVLISDLKASLAALLEDRSGNLGIVTVLLIVPMLGVAGTAVDLARLSEIRERIQQAADATVLDVASASYWKPYSAPGANIGELNSILKTKATAVFRGLLTQHDIDISSVIVDASAAKVNNQLQFQVTFSGAMKTSFLSVVGYPELQFGSEAKSTPGSTYVNVHVLVDNSPSMGLATSRFGYPATITMNGCVFACHISSFIEDRWDVYKMLGYGFRIDDAKSMLDSLVSTLSGRSTLSNQVKMAYYTLGKTSDSWMNRYVESIGTLTSDPTILKQNINKIDIMKYMSAGTNYFDSKTYLPEALQTLNTIIPDSKDGFTTANPAQMLIIITDGVVNRVVPSPNCTGVKVDNKVSCVEPINPAVCKVLKDRGIKIAVLLMSYYEPNGPSNWTTLINTLKFGAAQTGMTGTDYLTSSWQKCASDNLAYTITKNELYPPSAAIVGAIVDSILDSPRLTN